MNPNGEFTVEYCKNVDVLNSFLSRVNSSNWHTDWLKLLGYRILKTEDVYLLNLAVVMRNSYLINKECSNEEIRKYIQYALDNEQYIVISSVEVMDRLMTIVVHGVRLKKKKLLYNILYLLRYNLFTLNPQRFGDKQDTYIKVHNRLNKVFFKT